MVNSERTITLMQQAVEPPGEARADWLILTLVAQHLGFGKSFPYRHAAEVFDEIRRSWNPQTGYDLRGISYERLRQQSRQWPCAPDAENGEPIRYLECGDPPAPLRRSPVKQGDGRAWPYPLRPHVERSPAVSVA